MSHVAEGNKKPLGALTLGAIGIVYGDIGTSPLYALKACFGGDHGVATTPENIIGLLSVIFWAAMIVVTLKYVTFILRADNRGEGGILALMALTMRSLSERSNWRMIMIMLGLFGAALFYGDSMITPAISVLSAVEGMALIAPNFSGFVLPITLAIITGLFFIQKHGTSKIGKLFAPVMVIWFLVLAILGVHGILQNSDVLKAINPWYAVQFFLHHRYEAFLSLGAVVLVLTGGEALYADMGHFGIKPIRYAWLGFVFPALMLNYFGQGSLLLSNPAAASNPFYLLAPQWALAPLVILATLATIIASQAVISGAFSVSSQAVQLGFCPRLKVMHTSEKEMGQIYVPVVNWALFLSVFFLVVGFKNSSNLEAAYGIAVTGTMVITTILAFVAMRNIWKEKHHVVGNFILVGFLLVDLVFFSANVIKIPHGGWFPLLVGVILFVMLTTWKRGREILMQRLSEDSLPLDLFIDGVSETSPLRVEGNAVFMTSNTDGVPHALLHNLKHNKVLHERVVLLTVKTEDIPFVAQKDRLSIIDLGKQFYRITLRYGFKEEPDVPFELDLHQEAIGFDLNMMETSFFLSRETLIASAMPGMALWREKLFVAMSKNAQKATDFFKIPTNRVVELGTQIEL